MEEFILTTGVLTETAEAVESAAEEAGLLSRLGTAGVNTLLGMGIVFLVLILISLVISSLGLINKLEGKKTDKKPKEEAPKAQAEEAIPENPMEDLQLIAVITAAIAAYEGGQDTEGFTVRSIRRVSAGNQWKRG